MGALDCLWDRDRRRHRAGLSRRSLLLGCPRRRGHRRAHRQDHRDDEPRGAEEVEDHDRVERGALARYFLTRNASTLCR